MYTSFCFNTYQLDEQLQIAAHPTARFPTTLKHTGNNMFDIVIFLGSFWVADKVYINNHTHTHHNSFTIRKLEKNI